VSYIDYRYSFQGQEKDAETGKVAFQLRLYDPRINRWLTTDPKGQYHSSYMAMGNNPISSIDPDGGSSCGGEGEPPCELPSFSITASLNKMKQNVMDTFIGWGDVLSRTFDWGKGTAPKLTEEYETNFANAFKDAWRVSEARNYAYEQLNRARDLTANPITDYGASFGLEGLGKAGADPYEQFVGSYSVTEIKLVTNGDVMQLRYTLRNETHANSAFYKLSPSWEGGPMGTVEQVFSFTENIIPHELNSRGKGVINHYRMKNYKTPLR